jgi:hypothetical protein
MIKLICPISPFNLDAQRRTNALGNPPFPQSIQGEISSGIPAMDYFNSNAHIGF